jgi:hypothetical protein
LRSTVRYAIDEEGKENVIATRDEWRLGELDSDTRQPWTEIPIEPVPYRIVRMGRGDRLRFIGPSLSRAEEQQVSRLRPHVLRINAFRDRISYYSASQFTNPGRCPSSIEIDEDGDLVGPSRGRGEHQKFLLDLYQLRSTNPAKYKGYMSLVGQGGLRLISHLLWKRIRVASSSVDVRIGGRVVKRRRERILLVPSLTSNRDRLSFSQLSEGTFKTLALVFYLITDKSDLLLLEEPEVCVHQGLLTSIVELIKSESRAKQIIFSTHSDVVLDYLAPEQVFAVNRKKLRGTIVKSVGTGYSKRKVAALKQFLQTAGNLGEYWRQGGLET